MSAMRTTMTPPLVPSRDGTVYLVLDDFGEFGRAYRETQEAQADRQTVLAEETDCVADDAVRCEPVSPCKLGNAG